jgi:hypothetical protein
MANNGEKSTALDLDAPAFDMEAMQAAASVAAYAVSSRDAHLQDFSMDKPEVWFSMVEAMFEDCNVTNSKQRYNKVLYRLPMAVMESLATLVSSIEDHKGQEYQELKKRVLAAHDRSRWEKLDSLLSFPKMGATLEELYMAIFLCLLPDSYREHFAHCELKMAEELVASGR